MKRKIQKKSIWILEKKTLMLCLHYLQVRAVTGGGGWKGEMNAILVFKKIWETMWVDFKKAD